MISPYIAFFIGVNICSQICLLKASICRYYYLQFNNIDDKSSIPRNDVHLESIVEHCTKHIHAIIWPGLVISSIAFSLYLFDMAYDTDDPSLGGPLAVMLLTLAVNPIAMYVFYWYNDKLEKELINRVSEIVEMAEVKNPIASEVS